MSAALPTGPRGRVLALGLLAILLAALWLAVAAPLLAWHAERAETLDRRATLADRMESVAATLPRLRPEAAGAPAAAAPRALLDGASDPVAGAALQGQLDTLAAAAGIALSSAELLPVEAAGAYRRVSLRLTGIGPWAALIRLLQTIDQASPRMIVDDLQILPAPSLAAGAAQPVAATLTVIAFRAGAPG